MQIPLIAALLVTPAGDGFCDTLREIVAAAPGGFVAVSDGPLEGGGFEGRLSPDFGAGKPVGCIRFEARSYVPDHGDYFCQAFFPPDAPPGPEMRRGLAERAAACLGVPAENNAASDGYVVRLPGVEIAVRSYPNYLIFVNGRHPHGEGPIDSHSLVLDIVAK